MDPAHMQHTVNVGQNRTMTFEPRPGQTPNPIMTDTFNIRYDYEADHLNLDIYTVPTGVTIST